MVRHTMMFAVCYLSGVDTVLEAMKDQHLSEFVKRGIYEEILPTVRMDEEEKRSFVDSVIERFLNPYNKHYLADIGMNAVYKFKSRLIPSLLDYVQLHHRMPRSIVFSLAALIVYYRPASREGDFLIGKRGDDYYTIRDNREAITVFEDAWNRFEEEHEDIDLLVTSVLQLTELWGLDLNTIADLKETVVMHVRAILEHGMKNSIKKLGEKTQK